MFSLRYVVVENEFDEFFGQSGFFEFDFNQKIFGEMCSEGVIDKIIPEYLYDWLCRLVEVAIHLKTKQYVLLSNVENADDWIEFRRKGDKLFVSMVRGEKRNGCSDIEFQAMCEMIPGEWVNEEISFHQFINEIIVKVREYVEYISGGSSSHIEAEILSKRLDVLEKRKTVIHVLDRKNEVQKALDRMALKYRFLSDDKKHQYWRYIYKNVCYFCNIGKITVEKGDYNLIHLSNLIENDGSEYCATVIFKTDGNAYYEIGACVRGVPIFRKLKI